MAWETDLAWLIVCVEGGQAVQITAHRLIEDGAGFTEIALHTDDWGEAPRRAPLAGPGTAAPGTAAPGTAQGAGRGANWGANRR